MHLTTDKKQETFSFPFFPSLFFHLIWSWIQSGDADLPFPPGLSASAICLFSHGLRVKSGLRRRASITGELKICLRFLAHTLLDST